MIRNMTETDHDLFLEMSREFYQSPAVSHNMPTSVYERTFREALREGERLRGYILEAEGQPVGYALCVHSWATEVGGAVCWLEELYVRAPWRSLGLGQEFFDFLHRTRPGDMLRFRLEVMPQNTRARALYGREGFTEIEYLQLHKDFLPADEQ